MKRSSRKIISIHIPKTAGTSFRNTLEYVYGKNSVLSVYDDVTDDFRIPKKVKVLHGHIKTDVLIGILNNNPEWKEAGIITWIREPVLRFVSNYYYLRKVAQSKMEPGLGQRMIKTIEEYLARKEESNRMQAFFDLKKLADRDILFVGETENYDKDLDRLAKTLAWPVYKSFQSNRTGTKESVNEEIIEKIQEANRTDLLWYKEMKVLADQINTKTVTSGFISRKVEASKSNLAVHRFKRLLHRSRIGN